MFAAATPTRMPQRLSKQTKLVPLYKQMPLPVASTPTRSPQGQHQNLSLGSFDPLLMRIPPATRHTLAIRFPHTEIRSYTQTHDCFRSGLSPRASSHPPAPREYTGFLHRIPACHRACRRRYVLHNPQGEPTATPSSRAALPSLSPLSSPRADSTQYKICHTWQMYHSISRRK